MNNKLSAFERSSRFLPWLTALLLTALVAGCSGGSGGGRDAILDAGDIGPIAGTAPTVTFVAPLPKATDVSVNTKIITAAFTKAMDPATLTAASFTLACPAGTPVTGAVTYLATGNVATLTLPAATNLPASTVCTATITTAVRDATGIPLASNFVWTFTTGLALDTTAPTVTGTINANVETGVAINAKVGATFSEVMDPLTITGANFGLKNTATGAAVAGTVSYVGVNALFIPASNLANSTNYTVTVKGGASGVKDLAGNPMVSDFVISWTTGAAPDTTAPTVTGTIHTNGQTNVAINTNVGATFSEAMDPLTVDVLNFTVKQTATGTPVVGVVTYSGVSAVFNPVSNLAPNTNYTTTVIGGASGVKDLAGIPMVSDFTISWTTGAAPDTTAPTVTATINANGQTNVAINAKVGATFSEAMDPLTITNVNFTVKQTATGTPVAGVVSYSGVSALFIPVSNLANSTNYTVTVKGGASGVKDLAGNPKVNDFVISWTTGAAPDTTAPFVIGTVNANGAINIAVNAKIGATFSEAMDPLTITNLNFTLKETVSGAAVAGTVSYAGVNAVFIPLTALANSTRYTVTVKGGANGVKDLAGNPSVNDFVISWTTGAAPDVIAPTVSSTFPVANAIDVPLDSTITATFSEAMDPLTMTDVTFKVACPVGNPGTVGYALVTKAATLTTAIILPPSTTCTATISTGVEDLAGNAMASPFTWTFRTAPEVIVYLPPPGTGPGTSPPPQTLAVVNLGRAVNFAVLAGTGISNTQTTTVTGDVGAATQTVPPTLTAGYVNYQLVTDQPLIDALADIPAALTDANGRTCNVSDAGVLNTFSGQSFAPGVYCYGGAITVTGTLNLNGRGLYIFRTGSTLDTVASAIVAYTGDATSANTSVFWVPVGATTIGTLTTFKGTVISAAAITVGASATLQNGRVLSTAAVTMSTNVISRPFP